MQKETDSEQEVRKLLNSPAVTPPTRKTLLERMGKPVGGTCFFSSYQYDLLSVVCNLLIDQDPENELVNIAFFIDERLAANNCDGWRYNNMPPDGEMLKKGMEGIDETSSIMFGRDFISIDKQAQLQVLQRVREGSAAGNTWVALDATRFFEELLAEVTEIFYSHPVVQLQLGYFGMADANGWENIGLNQADNMETGILKS